MHSVDTNDEGVLVVNNSDESAQHVGSCPFCGFEGALFCLIDTNTECDRRDGHPGVCMRGPNAIDMGSGTE